MAIVPSSDHRLRAADPGRPPGPGTRPAGTVFIVVVGTLVVAALLNAGPMLGAAETSELGPRRDLALTFWRPIETVSSAAGLTAPRRVAESFRPPEGGGFQLEPLPETAADHRRGTLGHEPYGPAAAATSRPPAGPEASAPAPGSGIDVPPGDQVSAPGTPLGLPPPGDQGDQPGSEATTALPDGDGPPDDGYRSSRRPTAEDPLRLHIVGDSTMDPVGTSLLQELAIGGVVAAQLDVRISTGLSRPDFFDWPAHLRDVRAAARTEIVVIMLGANDAQPFLIDEAPESFGTERWVETYRQRVRSLLEELTFDGGWVIWVGQPVMRSVDFDQKMALIDQIYREEVARYPTAVFIDSRAALSDGTGNYQAYVTETNGDQLLVRAGDGVHLTPTGGDRLAALILAELAAISPVR